MLRRESIVLSASACYALIISNHNRCSRQTLCESKRTTVVTPPQAAKAEPLASPFGIPLRQAASARHHWNDPWYWDLKNTYKHLMQLPLRLFSTTSILQAWPNLKHAGIRIGPQWQRLNQLQCLICLINLTSTIKSPQTSKTVTHTIESLWRGFCSTITEWNQIMLCHYIHRTASPSSTLDFQTSICSSILI